MKAHFLAVPNQQTPRMRCCGTELPITHLPMATIRQSVAKLWFAVEQIIFTQCPPGSMTAGDTRYTKAGVMARPFSNPIFSETVIGNCFGGRHDKHSNTHSTFRGDLSVFLVARVQEREMVMLIWWLNMILANAHLNWLV